MTDRFKSRFLVVLVALASILSLGSLMFLGSVLGWVSAAVAAPAGGYSYWPGGGAALVAVTNTGTSATSTVVAPTGPGAYVAVFTFTATRGCFYVNNVSHTSGAAGAAAPLGGDGTGVPCTAPDAPAPSSGLTALSSFTVSYSVPAGSSVTSTVVLVEPSTLDTSTNTAVLKLAYGFNSLDPTALQMLSNLQLLNNTAAAGNALAQQTLTELVNQGVTLDETYGILKELSVDFSNYVQVEADAHAELMALLTQMFSELNDTQQQQLQQAAQSYEQDRQQNEWQRDTDTTTSSESAQGGVESSAGNLESKDYGGLAGVVLGAVQTVGELLTDSDGCSGWRPITVAPWVEFGPQYQAVASMNFVIPCRDSTPFADTATGNGKAVWDLLVVVTSFATGFFVVRWGWSISYKMIKGNVEDALDQAQLPMKDTVNAIGGGSDLR